MASTAALSMCSTPSKKVSSTSLLDYSEIKVKCLECGREAFYGREELVKENWQCGYCGEENMFQAKYE